MTIAYLALLAASAVAAGLSGIRWLRVAQREHYLAGSTTRFAGRWWLGPGTTGNGHNRVLAGAVALGVALSAIGLPEAGVVSAAALVVGPFGLGLHGRTSKLHWTRRLRVLGAVTVILLLFPSAIALVAGGLGWAALVLILAAAVSPVVIDAALAITAPLERRLSRPFVRRAEARLKSVGSDVVAVTGSYGKTSTKGYIAHLLSGTKSVVASPASFNNRVGLARAVNEHLTPGTEVFVAEMGTYGSGEIAEMCSWVHPRIAVITAIGPVHLERMRSEDRIAEAKAEILPGAEVAVLNVDDSRLAALAESLGKRVLRCSAVDRAADVCVTEDAVWYAGTRIGDRIGGAADAVATNVACAVGVALEVGVPAPAVARRLESLPTASNRLTLRTGSTGFTIIDDTYNSNPAGTRVALAALTRHAREEGRKVVVTPGMVELGDRQRALNEEFAAKAAEVVDVFIAVGRTNRASLLAGAAGAPRVLAVDTREDAVVWVREHLGADDVVLYENDLPDHYP